MSSYLSLAAIENAELLAKHVQPILDSVISGNRKKLLFNATDTFTKTGI